eukprot:SAG31_NODE_12214_length_958_cov_1.201397_1_plen_158_part_10
MFCSLGRHARCQRGVQPTAICDIATHLRDPFYLYVLNLVTCRLHLPTDSQYPDTGPWSTIRMVISTKFSTPPRRHAPPAAISRGASIIASHARARAAARAGGRGADAAGSVRCNFFKIRMPAAQAPPAGGRPRRAPSAPACDRRAARSGRDTRLHERS